MSRPHCWECGHQLMYVHGKPVYDLVNVDGAKMKVHKDCKKFADDWNAAKIETAQDDVKTALTMGCYSHGVEES